MADSGAPNDLDALDLQRMLHPNTNRKTLQRDGPLVLARGRGVRVWDNRGNQYLEAMAGLWCTTLGYGDDELALTAYEQMKKQVTDTLRTVFRPEFLNRVDEIIVFHSLTEEHLKQIVDIQLNRLRQRLAERHIRLTLSDAAKTHLVQTGHDPAYGARPLKRVIQKELETSLGRQLLKGEVRDGQEVVVDCNAKGELTFTVK